MSVSLYLRSSAVKFPFKNFAPDIVRNRAMFLFVVVSRQTKKVFSVFSAQPKADPSSGGASAVNTLLSALISVNLRLILPFLFPSSITESDASALSPQHSLLSTDVAMRFALSELTSA